MTQDELENILGNVLLDAMDGGLTTHECDEAILEVHTLLRAITAMDNQHPTTVSSIRLN